ncbi:MULTISPECIES: hypothetical protein [unclassified Robiginitalea]|uniref:hypothetical protein n=1 Tax=Robiginitalea TaxID=252306 RepID=UPI00234B5991|nr:MULTISPECIES: hypothetical protein [unclassified Robiginitalea]MDC6354877.1 hypothetical protein [Robiginitalea sp. PM2]
MNRIVKNIDYILLMAIFLPYIPNGNGLRVEHLVVYSIFLILLLSGRFQKLRIFPHSSVVFLYGFLFIHVCISTIVNQVPVDLKFLANFENYTETFVLLLILNSLVVRRSFFTRERMFRLNRVFHILLGLNTVLILLEIFTPYSDSIIQYYVQNSSDGFREDTNSMGRYTGVFDIVFAGGFAYSLGLITWVYNFSLKGRKNFLFQVILLVLILIGGFASVSKVFFLGGILLASWLFINIGQVRPKIALAVLASITLALVAPYFIEDWKGFGLFEEFYSRFVEGSAMEALSSGRLGSDNGIYSMALSSEVPLFFGRGFTMGSLPFFDSEHVQFYFQGGVVAIFAYFLIYFRNYQLTFQLGKYLRNERFLFVAILSLAVFTAFGGPVFFMNRVRIFFFLQLFFLYRLCATKYPIKKVSGTTIGRLEDYKVQKFI